MSKESRVAAKYKNIATPLIRVKKITMILFAVLLIPSFICLIGFFLIQSARSILAIGFVSCFIPYVILLTIHEKIEKKARKPEMISYQIEEFISENNLTDAQIDELDRVLEDILKGTCTMKFADSLITFTDDYVVRYEETKFLVFLIAAKISDINEIAFIRENNDKRTVLYLLRYGQENDIDIEFDLEEYPDGIEKVDSILKSYFSNLEIKEISSEDYENERRGL